MKDKSTVDYPQLTISWNRYYWLSFIIVLEKNERIWNSDSESLNILIEANGSCDKIYSTGSKPNVYVRRGGFFGKIIYVLDKIDADERINEKIQLSKNTLIDDYSYKSEILIFENKKIKAEFKCLIDEEKDTRRVVQTDTIEDIASTMTSTSLAEFSSTNTGLAEKL